MMIPWWKVRREIGRLFKNFGAFPAAALTFLFGARYYDIFLAGAVKKLPGTQPETARCAVYLIFPTNGLLASHERCLRYLSDRDVTTTVVSNLPMSEEDKERVLQLCNNYIERPNFGYDFGGYRDGILSLEHKRSEIRQLILLNDSSWFPITDATDWLEDIDVLDVDFAAAASNYGLSRPEPESFREFHFEYRTDNTNFHYCSYALSLGPRAIKNPGFWKFWKCYPLSNSKTRTVRRGEIGLTQWALKNGLTHAATLDIAHMDQHLSKLEEDRLRRIVSMLMIIDDRRMRQAHAEFNHKLHQAKKEDLIRFILMAAARKGVSYATAEFNIFECGFPFLKKSPIWLEEDTSDKTMKILGKLKTSASVEAISEAQHIRTSLTSP